MKKEGCLQIAPCETDPKEGSKPFIFFEPHETVKMIPYIDGEAAS